MSNDIYRATWKGPGRDTEVEALNDIKLLNTILEEHAPELYAYATSTHDKDRLVTYKKSAEYWEEKYRASKMNEYNHVSK